MVDNNKEFTGTGGDVNISTGNISGVTGTIDYATAYNDLRTKYDLLETKCKELVTAYNAALSQMDALGFAILQFARSNKLELDKQQAQQQIPKT